MQAVDKLKLAMNETKSRLIERDEVVDLLATALIAEANMLLIGPPGAAKSAVFGDFFGRIEARRGFFALTKGSTPETVIGPMSINELKEHDRFKYNTTGMLPDVELGFVDEVFKGNALTRNAILQVLNERVLFNGGEVQPCPLIMCGAASNEYPDHREDAAFYDRFLVRYEVDFISDHSLRMQMARMALARGKQFAQATPVVGLDEIRHLHALRRKVTIPAEIDDAVLELYNTINALGHEQRIGDRRFAETFGLVAASTVLHGRDTATRDDLAVFAHTAWTTPDSRRDVQQAVIRIVSPEVADMTTMYDEIEAGFEQFLTEKTEADKNQEFGRILVAARQFGQTSQHNIARMEQLLATMEQNGQNTSRARSLYIRAKSRLDEVSRAITA